MMRKKLLPLCMVIAAFVTSPAFGDQYSDEANRQNMMAEMRASAAASDRANFESQQRLQDNADRNSRNNSSSGSYGSSSSGTGSSSYASPSSASRGSSGPRSIVTTYTFTTYRQETPVALAARLEREAAAGNTLSAFNLGRVYYTGFDGVPRDDAAARRWFLTAAKAGHPGAEAQAGQMLYNGIGGPADRTSAMTWVKAAADQGDAYGQALYGFWTLAAQARVNPDVRNPEAVDYLVKAAYAGQLVAQGFLGTTVYRLGVGAPVDQDRAAKYLRLAADQGFAPAQAVLGRSYIYGTGVPKDYDQAAIWLRKGAAQNDAEANFLLGRLEILGSGAPADPAAGARLVKLAADAGNAEASGFYGVLLQQGIGVPQDQAAAVRYTAKAAQAGDVEGQIGMAKAYYFGHGVTKDMAQALVWFRKAAAQGNEEAMGDLKSDAALLAAANGH